MNDKQASTSFAELPVGKKRRRRGKSNVEDSGDNLNPESAFHSFRAEVASVNLSIGSLMDKRRKLYSEARKDGIDVKAALRVMKEQGANPDELIAEHNAVNRYRELVGLPYSTPLTLESTLSKDKDLRELAFKHGMRLGYRGGSTKDNPYEPGSDFGQEWLRGYTDASAVMASLVKPSVLTKLKAQ
jgi:hypothetical protein